MADPQKFDPWQEFTQPEKPVVAKPSTPRIFKKSQPATYDAFSDFVKASEKRGETLPPGQAPIDPIANAKAMEEFKAAHADDNKASTAVPIQSPANITSPVIAAPQLGQPPFSLAGQPAQTTGGQGFSLNPNPTPPTPATAKLKIPAPSPVMPTEESVKTHAAEIARASAALDAQAAKLDADRKKLEAFVGDPKIHARAMEQFNELVDEHTKNRKALDQSNGYLQKDIQILNKSRESPKRFQETTGMMSVPGVAMVPPPPGVNHEQFKEALNTVLGRMSEPVKAEEIEKIPGLKPEEMATPSFTGLGKTVGDEPVMDVGPLSGITRRQSQIVSRAALKTVTDWESPAMKLFQFGGKLAMMPELKYATLTDETKKALPEAEALWNQWKTLLKAGKVEEAKQVLDAYNAKAAEVFGGVKNLQEARNFVQWVRRLNAATGAGFSFNFAAKGIKDFREGKYTEAAADVMGSVGSLGIGILPFGHPLANARQPNIPHDVEIVEPKAEPAQLPSTAEGEAPTPQPSPGVKPVAPPEAPAPSSKPAVAASATPPETATPVGTEPKVYRGTSERRLDLATRHEITDFMNGPVGYSRDEAVYAIAQTRMVGDREPTKDEKETLEAIVRGEAPMPPKPQPGEKLSNTIKTEAKAEPKPDQSPEKPSEVPAVKPGLPVASAEPEKVAEIPPAEGRPTEAPAEEALSPFGVEVNAKFPPSKQTLSGLVKASKNEVLKQQFKRLGITAFSIEEPYKFGLSEQANIQRGTGVIRLNADADDPENSLAHELAHDIYDRLDPQVQERMRDYIEANRIEAQHAGGIEERIADYFADVMSGKVKAPSGIRDTFLSSPLREHEVRENPEEALRPINTKVRSWDEVKSESHGWTTERDDLEEMVAKYGDRSMVVKDVNGGRSVMPASAVARLRNTPGDGFIREIYLTSGNVPPETVQLDHAILNYLPVLRESINRSLLPEKPTTPEIPPQGAKPPTPTTETVPSVPASGGEQDKWPDGRLRGKVGDKVYQQVAGFGGTPAYVRGEVYMGRGGPRVKVTGSSSMFGAGAGVGKTYPLDERWTVHDDPEIARRKATKESEAKASKDKVEAEYAADRAKLEAYHQEHGKLAVDDVKIGDVLEDIVTGQKTVVTEMVKPADWSKKTELEVYGTEPEHPEYAGGYLGNIANWKKVGHTELPEKATEEPAATDEAAVTPKPEVVPPEETADPDADNREKLKKLQAVRFKTANDEKQIEILKERIATPADKWKVGDGVGWKVYGNQINRGFRVVSVHPESKTVTIRSVADTGITTSGGDTDKIGDETLHVADLVRDTKYNAASKPPTPKIFQKGKKDPLAAIREHYKPGNVVWVDYWKKYDKVLDFKVLPDGRWAVNVIESDKDGNPSPGAQPRMHSTAPSRGDRVEKAAPAPAPSTEAAPPIPQHPKYNEFFVLAISNARPGQIVGPLGEMLKGRNIRKLYQDVLDTPIMAMDRPVEQGQEKEMDRGAEFYGASGTYKGKQTIFVNPKHVNEIINTVLEEAAHVLRKSKGRALGKVDVSNFDEAAYKALPSEISAKKMAEYAASIPESPTVSEAPATPESVTDQKLSQYSEKQEAISEADPRTLSDEQLAQERAEITKVTHPLYDQLEAMGDKAFRPNDPNVRYVPEAQAIADQIKPFATRDKLLDFEVKRREQEAANKRASEARDKRVAEAPVSQHRNGWEIVSDGGEYVLRHPDTKEEVYRGKLSRTREVADESKPEKQEAAPVEPPKPAIESGKLAEAMLKYTSDPNKKKEINRLVSKVGTGEITDEEAVRALKYISGRPNVVRAEDALDSTGTSIDEQRARGQKAIESVRKEQAPPIPMAAPKPAISKLFPKAKPKSVTPLPTVQEVNAAYRPMGSGQPATEPPPKKDLKGFADNLSPMVRGKIQQALDVSVMNQGKPVTRRELIEQKVSAGSTVQTTKDGERRLTAPDGSFLGEDQITKSGMSYADYLANQAATKTEFSLTPPPVGPPAYIEKMADSVWDELDEDEKKKALAEFEHGYQVPVTLLNQANILGLNPEESLQFGNAMRDLLMKPPMEAADFVDEVADKIWADPRQKHDEVFADEMPAKEAAANRVKEFKKSGIRLTEELAASEADRLITEEQQATLLRPMNDQDWEDALDSAVNKRLGRNLTPDEFDGLIKDAKAHVLADGGPGLSRQGVEQAADWLVSQKPELAKPAEHKPESEPEKPKDLKLEWDKKENGVRGSLTLPDGQVVEGHWIDVSQMDRALGNKRSEPGRYTEYIKERIVKQYVRQTDTSKDNALQQKVMDNVRPPGRPLVAATYDASHFTGEFAVEPFVANDFLKYRIVERKAGSDQRWEAAGITIANSYNDALGYMVDSYMGKDGYRFLDPVAREQYEKQYAEVQASEERIRKAEEDRVAVEKEAERAKMEFRKIGKEEEKKPTATEADVITAKPTLTAEASGKPLAQSGLKVPKPKKIVPGINFHKAVIKQSNTFPALQEVRVENGKMISTDLEVAAITPTDLPDGIYRLVGNQWEKGLIDRENMPLVPIDLPGKDGSILLPNFNDLARAERNISLEESRFTMQGALLKIQGGKLDIVATDGHRLSRNTYGVKGVPDGSYIIPRFAILSILRDKADGPVLISFDKEPTLTAGNPMVTLQTGNVKIVTKLLTGSFPKYEAAMPDKVGQVAVIPKDKLTAALKDLKPYIDKRSKIISLRKMDSGHIEITAEDNDRKVKKSVEVPVTYQQGGTAAKTAISVVMPIRNDTRGAFLGLNHDYLTDAVESVSGNSVYIGLQNMRKIDGPSIISGKNPVTKKGDTIFDREKELNQKAEKAPFVTKPLDVTAEWGRDTARIKAEGKVIDNIAVVPTYDVPSKADAEKGKKPEIVPDSFAIYNVPTGAAVKYHEVMGRDDKIMSFETEIEAKVAAMRMAEAKGYSDNVKRLLAEDPYQEIEELDKPKPEEPKTKPEEPKGGPTLRGSVLGMDVAAQAAKIAVEKNVLPILKNANVSLHEILAIAKNWITPRFGVPTDALDAVMRLIGDRAKAQYLMQETMAGIKKAFSEMPQEDQVDFIDRYKAGEEQVTPELETVAEMYRKSDEERYALKQQYRESLPHKENHFRVFWKVIPGSQGEKVKLSPGQKVRWKDANNEEWIEGTVQSVNNAAKKVTVKPKDGEPLTLDRNQVFKAGGLGAILGRRPLQGSMGWAKKSTLASISEGLLMGGEPFTYNPQELFEMSVADDMKFITAQEMWSQIGDLGYRKFVREGQAPPEGYARLDDRLARVYFPATVTPKGAKKGFETAYKSGEWYVEENVHRILKNHLSHDLIREKQFGRSLMALKNLTTGIELSLSPFHFFFETYEAMSSEMGLGFSRAWNLGLREARLSELPRALKQIIASPFAPVRFAMTGSAIRSFMKSQASLMPTKDEDVYVPSPEVKERYAKLLREYPYIYDIVTSYFRAGGNLRQHAGMRLQATEGFKQALANEDYLGAIVRAFPAFTQLIMKPFFDIYIPNLKVALYARVRASLMEEHADDLGSGKMTQGELDRMALDSVENRFGEMNFDKLFWNRTFKTVLQGLFRSVTWKFGNIGEFSGAAIGQGKEVGKSLGLIGSGGGGTKPPGGSQGSGGSEPPESGDSAAYKQSNFMRIPKLDHRMAWGLGLVITTAVLSEILQYIATGFYNEKKTGKWEPQHVRNWKDVIDPRIGGVDNRGKPNRVQPPTYIRDLLHLIKSPVGYIRSSLSGIIIRSLEALANQNYQHVRITEPEDSYLVKEAKRVGHIFALPFAVQQAWDSKQRGGSKAATIAGFLGFSRAPRDMDFTPAEEMAVGFLQSTGDFGTRSPEQARVQQDVANLIAYGKSEDKRAAIAKIRGMEKRGTLTKRKADLAIKKINSSWLQQLEQRLTLPEKFDVYDVASPEEKAQLWPVIVPETRQGQLARLRQISELPKGVRQRIALRWNEIIKQRPGETPAPEEEAPETEPETRQPKGIYRLFPGAQRQPPAPAESGMER